MARTRNLDAKIRVQSGRGGVPYPLRSAFFVINGSRNRGVPVTFQATGPDAEKVIEIIAQTCTDPPPIHKSTLDEFMPAYFGKPETERN